MDYSGENKPQCKIALFGGGFTFALVFIEKPQGVLALKKQVQIVNTKGEPHIQADTKPQSNKA